MGPLNAIKVIELGGTQHGPVSYCGMLLADLGAARIRIDRPAAGVDPRHRAADGPTAFLGRGQRSITLDLSQPQAVEVALRFVQGADLLIEGFRPGVLERLGLAPEQCWARNPALIIGRLTGWGQTGPLSRSVGHDINYLALSGALHCCGRAGERPVVPVNFVADMGGGGLLLAYGLVCALLEARTSGRGQVIDAAMVDGAISQMSAVLMMRSQGHWRDERGTNTIDSGAPFYDVYETADGKYVAVGALEPEFFAKLCELTQVDPGADRMNPAHWPQLRESFAAAFRSRTRDDWAALPGSAAACITPVLTIEEARAHPHNRERHSFEDHPVLQPAAAPRFSRTPGITGSSPSSRGAESRDLLRELGFDDASIDALSKSGALVLPSVPA